MMNRLLFSLVIAGIGIVGMIIDVATHIIIGPRALAGYFFVGGAVLLGVGLALLPTTTTHTG